MVLVAVVHGGGGGPFVGLPLMYRAEWRCEGLCSGVQQVVVVVLLLLLRREGRVRAAVAGRTTQNKRAGGELQSQMSKT